MYPPIAECLQMRWRYFYNASEQYGVRWTVVVDKENTEYHRDFIAEVYAEEYAQSIVESHNRLLEEASHDHAD